MRRLEVEVHLWRAARRGKRRHVEGSDAALCYRQRRLHHQPQVPQVPSSFSLGLGQGSMAPRSTAAWSLGTLSERSLVCAEEIEESLTGALRVTDFETEENHDFLTVNGKAYSGTQGPSGIVPHGQIIWRRTRLGSSSKIAGRTIPSPSVAGDSALHAPLTAHRTSWWPCRCGEPEEFSPPYSHSGCYWRPSA